MASKTQNARVRRLADRIRRQAELEDAAGTELGDRQIEACARILLPILTGAPTATEWAVNR